MRGEFGYVRFIHDGAKDPKLQYICLLLICHFDTGGGDFVTVYTVFDGLHGFSFLYVRAVERAETSFIIVNNVRRG